MSWSSEVIRDSAKRAPRRTTGSKVRAIVAQIGARRRYAVPRMLFKAGALARLYTDLAFTSPPLLLGWLPGIGGAVRRRTIEGIPPDLIRRALMIDLPWRRRVSVLQRYLEIDDAFGRRMLQWGLGDANLLYGMYGSGTPFWRFAREHGVKVVAEVFITPMWHRIVHEERLAFPDWEPPASDAARELELAEVLTERCLANADVLLCPSDAVRQGVHEFLKCSPSRRHIEASTVVLPYAFNCSSRTSENDCIRGRILFVGGAELRKGIHYLARAARMLAAKRSEYKFRIAGMVSERIRTHPEAGALTFLGHLTREEVDREYALADLFVLPTLAEGSAESVREAMAMGLPVVTTPSAGSDVRDGWSGLIVPERNSDALAAAIERVVRDRGFRAFLSKNARAAAAEYREETFGPRLVRTLESLLG